MEVKEGVREEEFQRKDREYEPGVDKWGLLPHLT